jgi:hypothetical protein
MNVKQYSIEEYQGVLNATCSCGKRELLQRGDVAAFELTGLSGQLKQWRCEACVSRSALTALKRHVFGIVA